MNGIEVKPARVRTVFDADPVHRQPPPKWYDARRWSPKVWVSLAAIAALAATLVQGYATRPVP